jgi:hypothetical protein
MRLTKNAAVALALTAFAVLLYAVSVVRMSETEERRHRTDPQAHVSR